MKYKIMLSLFASEVMLAILKGYHGYDINPLGGFMVDKKEMDSMFDSVTADKVLETLKEHKSNTNLRGLITGLREIAEELEGMKDNDLIEINFKHLVTTL